jgi:glycine C-acetyltransferase
LVSKQNRTGFITTHLRDLEEKNLYRRMKAVSVDGTTAIVDGKKAIHLCSNDYLGLARNQQVIRQASKALKEVSQCSSRLIAGNSPRIGDLEAALASHRGTKAALVFPTGYMANLGAITALASNNSTILSDALNHASIIDACKLSGATVRIFRHNDPRHLEDLLRNASGRAMIVTEGIFSMDGDISELREITKIAKEHNALTVVDDAHGDFIFGRNYSGVPSLLGANVDVHVSSLSKALGCFGGYVAASAETIELLINTAKQFIYTSALPDHLCVAAGEAIKFAKRGSLQARLNANIAFFRKKLVDAGFVTGSTSSQIIPIMIGREDFALEFSKELLKRGVFAQPVRYPTVKKGSARLRLSVTAAHTKEQLSQASDVISSVGKRLKIVV